MSKYFYKSHKLPHWQPPGETFFITARLYGSIPIQVIENLKSDYKLALAAIENEGIDPDDAQDYLPEDLKAAIKRLQAKKSYAASKQYFARFDDFLDSNLNEPYWLGRKDIAQFNMDNFHFYAERYFTFWAGTIMSNHFHILITLNPDAPILWKVLQDMKKYSATQCNQILGRTGKFWEQESYDHLLREGEFDRILHYILNNPVKAGIVKTWSDHPWTYCHPEL